MSPFDKSPTYNLKVVVQETGIKPDTLRAWERRYGLPQPGRTSGGHRLYSEYDLHTIKWLMSRQREGLSISRAVDLWNSLIETGEDPLSGMDYPSAPRLNAPIEVVTGSTIDEIRQAWVRACLDFNERSAEHIIAQAFALYPIETVTAEVLQKGLAQIGTLWFEGQISVQQEHFASALVTRRLHALLAAAPPPSRAERILVACPPEEYHTVPALLLTLLLRQAGWDVIYLGADVPMAQLEETLDTLSPRLVILVAMLLFTAANLMDLAHLVTAKDIALAFGGPIFVGREELKASIPGHYLGDTLERSLSTVEGIISRQLDPPAAKHFSKTHQETLDRFREKRAALEARAAAETAHLGLSPRILKVANIFMSRDIDAALRLGDINHLTPEIDWTRQLTANYHIPAEFLGHYLSAYHQAAHTELGTEGQAITDWLASVAEHNAGA